jgi:hypothetical protein
MNMRALALATGLILAGCATTPKRNDLGELHPKLRHVYTDWFSETGGVCDAPKYCGDIVSINCNAETDGPYLYFNNATAELVMGCGGECEDPDPADPKSCKSCPPQEWTCLADYP